MKKLVLLTILISGSCFAQWNFNSDCIVNMNDFAQFAQGWGTTYDLNDLASFADQWLEFASAERAPVPVDSEIDILQGTTRTITLSATDANNDTLFYSIQSVSDPNGTITGISSYPADLASNTFEFNANSSFDGKITIVFGVDDLTGLSQPCGGISLGKITVNVNAQPVKPTANNQSINVMQFVTATITLDATDDQQPAVPGRLSYIITSLPTSGTIQDPLASGNIITSVPYTLIGGGKSIWYSTDIVGSDTFDWKANDGGTGDQAGDSNIATATVTAETNVLDSLDFDGNGTISIADGDYIDLVDGWGIDFWVKTRDPFAGLIKKRSSGIGYEIGIVSGKPKIYLYDNSGTIVVSIQGHSRIDDGQWHQVAFTFNTTEQGVQIGVQTDGSPEYYQITGISSDFSNSDNLIIGLDSRRPYRSQIDKVRFFSGIADPTIITCIIQGLSERTDTQEVFLGFGLESSLMWMCDEGSGTIITDSKTSKTGTISSLTNIKWHPQIELFEDASVKQHLQEMEKRKCKTNGI